MKDRILVACCVVGLVLLFMLIGSVPGNALVNATPSPQPAAYAPVVIRQGVASPTPTPTSMPAPHPTTITPSPMNTPTPTATQPPTGTNRALRFYGNGTNQIDRVKIRIDAPARPADIGVTDFTIEFWLKASLTDNANGHICANANDDWINGHVIIDRDIFGSGDNGDFGISLASGRIAFGVSVGNGGTTLCGTSTVADGQWHHIAAQRRASDGRLWLYVDGALQAERDGADGDASYRDGRTTSYPNSDPYLVFGAEKHDAGKAYPSYSGLLDEVRLSNTLRYAADFTRPSAAFAPDANTVALYHFDEASGTAITDSSGASGGPSNGLMNVGGNPQGPMRVTDVPF